MSLASAGASRRFARLAWAAMLIVNLSVIGVVVVVAAQSRQREIKDASQVTENYARILEEGLAGFIRNIDNTVLTVADEFEWQRARGGIDERAFETFLASQFAHVPDAVGLRVVDARGIIRHAVGEVRVTGTDVSDREHFRFHRDHRDAGLAISEPLLGRINKRWVIVFSRRLNNRDGAFAGEVHISVASAQLSRILARLDLGPKGLAELWTRTTLVSGHFRRESDTARAGATTPSPELAGLIKSGEAMASYQARSDVDGVDRHINFRRVGDYPLFVVVGLASEDYLADWRADTLRLLIIALLFMGITLVFGWFGHKAWRRSEQTRGALIESERQLDLCIGGAELAIVDWDVRTDKVVFGTTWRKLLGYEAGELEQSPSTLAQLVRPEDIASARDALRRHLKGQTAMLEVEVRMRHKEGHWVWILARGRAGERGTDGRAQRVTGIGMDITRRKQAEAEIARLSQWNELLLDSAGEGILGIDLEGRCTFINAAALGALGYGRREVVGKKPHELFHHHREDAMDCREAECPVFATIRDGIRREVEEDFIRKNGEVFPVQMTVTPIHEFGAIVGAEVVFQDIARRKAMEMELIRLATIDALTNVANRRRFLEYMESELARVKRFGETSFFLMLDIDNFKHVNDTWGHSVGDTALRHFADICRLRIRQSDYFGRLGGEEFGIILSRTDVAGALGFAEALRRSVADSPAQTAKGPVPLTVSIGVAEFAAKDETSDNILVRADVALYKAKTLGRNSVVLDPSLSG
jgi:diguanylate cyclase (GGDEF)-like protein/PAS domain S-box-containing protein